MADEMKGEGRLRNRITRLEELMEDFLRAQGHKRPERPHEPPREEEASVAEHTGRHAHPGLTPELEHMNALGEKLIRVLEEIRDRL